MTARQDLGALVVHIEGSSGNLEAAFNRAQKKLNAFYSEVESLGASSSAKEIAERERVLRETTALQKKALEANDMKMLQRELFESSASNLEIAIKEITEHYDMLRERYKGNEQMLTMITQAEEAKRLQIRKAYLVQSEAHFRWMMRQIIRTSIYAYALSSAFRGVADAMKTWRTTKDPGETFLAAAKALPAIGRVVEEFAEMWGELSGTTAFKENIELLNKSLNQVGDIKTNLENQLELLKAVNDEEKKRIEIRQNYEKTVSEISGTGNKADIQKQMMSLNGEISVKEQQIKELSNKILNPKGFQGSFWESSLNAWELSRIKKEYDQKIQLYSQLNAQYKNIVEAENNAKALQEKQLEEQAAIEQETKQKPIRDMIENLYEESEMFSKTAGEIAAYKAKLAGADEETQNFIKTQTDLLEQRKLFAEGDKTIESLRKEISLFGLEGAELEIAKAKLQGYNEEQQKEIGLLAAALEAKKKQKALDDALVEKQKTQLETIKDVIKTNKEKANEEVRSIEANKELMKFLEETPGAFEKVNKYIKDKYFGSEKFKEKQTGQYVTYDPRYISSAALSQSIGEQQLATQKQIVASINKLNTY